MVVLEILPSYGYCLLVAVASAFTTTWMAMQVGGARKKFGVKYPTMYSADNDNFNCYQRAHQNTLEAFPLFLAMLLVGGLHSPCFSAAMGAVWCVSRVLYAKGYYTGDPEKRVPGAIGSFISLFALYYGPIRLAGQLLGWF
ncbi:unnamed protein product [Meganyctiphanes norvegica]|uniref:Glutathione S-transferase 3, mitochondrial n=1 Tax=Meganyctiphanes norvegica TaxID=48144 RepID=A0AAV2RJK2_MEGNR